MRKKKPEFSFKPLLIGLGIVVVLIGVLWVPVIYPAYLRRKAEHDVAQLLEALRGYTKLEGEQPVGDTATICRLLRGETVDGQNQRRLDYVEAYQTNTAGEFVDPWGMPYRFLFEKKIRVISSGPNKTDDQGRGDDIVAP